MPQMAPMPWISLLIFSLIIMLIYSTIIFFNFENKKVSILKSSQKPFLIKW